MNFRPSEALRHIAMLLTILLTCGALLGSAPVLAQDTRVVLINVFEVPVGSEDATQRWWETARDFLKTQPGYLGTRLHRNIDPTGRFSLVNVAEWASPAAFQAANQALQARLGKPPAGVTFSPGLFRLVAE